MLLPEKIDVMPLASRNARKGELAAHGRVTTACGWWPASAWTPASERRNEAWWFSPDGTLVTNYLKHFMAPPEREFVSGGEFPVEPRSTA